MTANEMFGYLANMVIALKFSALVTLLFFIYQKATQFFFSGRKHASSDTSDANALLHSYFIVAILVAVFHFIISTITSQQALLYPKDKVMTTNEIFAALDDVIIGLELMALAGLLFFSYQKASQLFFGGKKNINSDADALLHSYFIVTISVAVFHFTTSKIGHLIIGLPLDKSDLRQLFYFVIFVMELAAISCIFVSHKIRKCPFSDVARVVIFLGLILCVNLMIQYYSHGIQGLDVYHFYYRAVIVFVNISTLLAISVYPVFGLRKLKKQSKEV